MGEVCLQSELLSGQPQQLCWALKVTFQVWQKQNKTADFGYGAGDWVCYGITVRLNFEEKYNTILGTILFDLLLYGTEMWFYFFCTIPYSSRRPNLKSPKGLLC